MRQVNEGSEEAARLLFDLYGHHILHAVRRKLSRQLRSRFDSVDFVQDVWASFFADKPLPEEFENPRQLITFLTNMARNKVVDATRQRLVSEKRNVNRECSLESKAVNGEVDLIARQATPSQALMAQEEWDRLLESIPGHYREVLVKARNGLSVPKIARDLDMNPRTVRRVVHRYLPGVAS
jgi:RNA polymerase sigma-70 factor (ECF subfamily)